MPKRPNASDTGDPVSYTHLDVYKRQPYYPKGKRGRPPMGIEKMLRMYLLQIWFNLSDPATEDAIYDSYAMRKFTDIDFMTETVPDETTLCKFRHLLETNGLNKLFFDAINPVSYTHLSCAERHK